MGKLDGKVAVVTGASKGIGASIAKAIALEGAAVVVNYSAGIADAERTVAEIEDAGGIAIAIRANISNASELATFFEAVKNHCGRIDVLVNNAGVFTFGPLEAVTEDDISKMFSVNVTGLLLVSKGALPLFPSEGGSIINIGSYVATQMPSQTVVCAATKGAVNTITGVLANELGPRNIRVNALLPGVTATEGFRASGAEGSDVVAGLVRMTSLGRIGQPQDIAEAAVFLATNESRWITGELIHVSGGLR